MQSYERNIYLYRILSHVGIILNVYIINFKVYKKGAVMFHSSQGLFG